MARSGGLGSLTAGPGASDRQPRHKALVDSFLGDSGPAAVPDDVHLAIESGKLVPEARERAVAGGEHQRLRLLAGDRPVAGQMLEVHAVPGDAGEEEMGEDFDAQPVQDAELPVARHGFEFLARRMPITQTRTHRPSRTSFSATPMPTQSQRSSAITTAAPACPRSVRCAYRELRSSAESPTFFRDPPDRPGVDPKMPAVSSSGLVRMANRYVKFLA